VDWLVNVMYEREPFETWMNWLWGSGVNTSSFFSVVWFLIALFPKLIVTILVGFTKQLMTVMAISAIPVIFIAPFGIAVAAAYLISGFITGTESGIRPDIITDL
jgi:hypothetical protein